MPPQVSTTVMLRAKLRWGLGPLLLVSVLLSLGSGLLSGTGPGTALVVTAFAALSTWTVAGLAVGLGAAEPNFHEENPARIASGVGGVLFMLLGMTYLVGMVLLLVGPANALEYALTTGYWPRPERLALHVCLSLTAIALSVLVHHLPLRRGARRLAHRES